MIKVAILIWKDTSQLADDKSTNTFARLVIYIYSYKSLIGLTDNYVEIASVITQEMVYIYGKHIFRQINKDCEY